jgi:hypothetical protein
MRDQILIAMYGALGSTATQAHQTSDLAVQLSSSHGRIITAVRELIALGLAMDTGQGDGVITAQLTLAGIQHAMSLA